MCFNKTTTQATPKTTKTRSRACVDLFLSIDKSILCNYADDNTLYTSGNDANTVINKLKQDFSKTFKWFYENFMILNQDKCYFLTFGPQPNFFCYNITIKNVSGEKYWALLLRDYYHWEKYWALLLTD